MKIFNRLADQFKKVQPLPEGTYHMQAEGKPLRVHLRLLKDGAGLFILNASTILQLNPTAAEYAFHYIKGTPPADAAKEIASRYRIARTIALEDYNDFAARIQSLIETPDLDPVSFLDFERVAPHSANLTAPLRLDCALTYLLPTGAAPDYAPTKRVTRELTPDEWRAVLDKAWGVGIPHITFTGGEPTLRDDLPELIAHAEKLGQVCGLLTDGKKLADQNYLDLLLQTGLDHILFLLRNDSQDSWKALEIIMPADIFVTVHVTVTPENVKDTGDVLERLAKLGVKSLSLGASDASLHEALHTLHDTASSLGLTLRWDLPVPYSAVNPVAHETIEDEVPSGAGKVWLYVEPDGDVLPTQGEADQVLGNLLTDPWEKIYHPA